MSGAQLPFEFQPELVGPTLRLRPLAAADWDDLYRIGGDPAVWALHPEADRYTEEKFHGYFAGAIASGGALVAVARGGGGVMGCSRFSATYAQPGEIEIGWTFLGRAWWGGATNTEMKHLMLNHAFRFVPRVIFRIGEHNARSRRATEKLGAALSERTQLVTINGQPSRNVYYSLSATDFKKQDAPHTIPLPQQP